MPKESLKLIFLCFSTTIGLLLTLNFAVQKAEEKAATPPPKPDQVKADKVKSKPIYVRKSNAS